MNQTQQLITLQKKDSAFIATPNGIIEIRRGKTDNRRLQFLMPSGLSVFKGKKDELKSDYVTVREDGEVVPSYTLLLPVIDSSGALLGISAVEQVLRLAPLPEVVEVALGDEQENTDEHG